MIRKENPLLPKTRYLLSAFNDTPTPPCCCTYSPVKYFQIRCPHILFGQNNVGEAIVVGFVPGQEGVHPFLKG